MLRMILITGLAILPMSPLMADPSCPPKKNNMVTVHGGFSNEAINYGLYRATVKRGSAITTYFKSATQSWYILAGAGSDGIAPYNANSGVALETLNMVQICAGPGDDFLESADNFLSDYLYGQDGWDDIYGYGSGNDRIFGGYGSDFIYNRGVGRKRIYGQHDTDDITCGININSGGDTVYGGSPHDFISCYRGKATIYGESGNDTLSTGSWSGDSYIRGGSGNDTVHGGSGDDRLYGGRGNDQLSGNSSGSGTDGTDYLSGGTGYDTCRKGDTYVSCEEIN